jgi:ribosome assembly protein RRB1
MAKRTVTEIDTSENRDGQPYAKAIASETGGGKRPSETPGEMGEFEDEWEDEIESDGEVVDGAERDGEQEDDAMEIDGIMPAIEEEEAQTTRTDEPAVYLPGQHTLSADEVLEPDQSVYEMFHSMNVTWPCLSFDVLRDNLGWERKRYPATSFIVTGTQANAAKNNEVIVMKMSHLHKTQKDDADSDSSDDENEHDDTAIDEDAILEHRSIPHHGSVNRIRARPLSGETLPPVSQPYHSATWSETGKVHIWDIRPLIESLNVPGYTVDKGRTSKPVYTIGAHGRAEGFAMDWSPASYASTAGAGGKGASGNMTTVEPRLLTGDIHSKIFLTTLTKSGFQTSPQPFASHTSSVEDIQWSPTESTVFASCSADRSVRIWDVRMKGRKNVVGISGAHESDVNVISWNRGTTYLVASGGDEGGIKIWDLRNLKGDAGPAPSPVASLTWHKSPITSIEWHPTEDSAFVASDSTNQVTLWDLSVEADDEQLGTATKDMLTAEGERLQNVPPQLLFVHQGQKDVKEVHWHPQIPGCVISTSVDGFNVFKTISI